MLVGANGRMGQAIQHAAAQVALITVVCAGDELQESVKNTDVVIDFSSDLGARRAVEIATKFNAALLVGTTGLSEKTVEAIQNASQKISTIKISNSSLGIAILTRLTSVATIILGSQALITIQETHPTRKKDSPSGTALALGKAIACGRDIALKEVANMVRCDTNKPRQKGEIGFATLRGGDVVGDHTVIFAGEGERIELSHKASKRDIFASGAIRAAIWASNKKSGFFSMRDVLNFSK